MNAVVRLSNRI